MESAPKPADEAARLAELRRLAILDTPPEERFDRLTRLVASLLDVPISLVSLVDADRQWFKSRVGLEATQTPRELAFCAHAILDAEPLVVPDAAADSRFADNPLVEADPNIRFYAGAPLVARSGHRLGTLCAIDRKPRAITPVQVDILKEMAKVVVDELELSVSLTQLQEHVRDLADKNQELDAFGYALSHDMQGPIRRIRAFCDLLIGEDATTDPGERAEYLGYIGREAETARVLLGDLRTYYEVGRGGPVQQVDAAEAIEAALTTLSSDIEATGAKVSVAELPPVNFLGGLLTSVFANLISNALKYRSSAPPVIEIRHRRLPGAHEFTVADNGVGIAERHLPRVFELLSRFDDRPDIPGSGMGLAVCKRVVTKAGGTIEVASTLGEGTTVSFTVPEASAEP